MTTISASTTTTTAYICSPDTTGTLVLQTGSSPTTAMTIDTSQNVGIGTSSPQQKLSVSGGVQRNFVSGETTDVTGFIYKDTSGNSAAGMYFGNTFASNYGAYLTFKTTGTADSGGPTERARIDSSGNLLVGKTVTTSSVAGAYLSSGGILNSTQAAGSSYANFYNASGTSIGFIANNGNASTTYSTTSDYRLKENIQPMTGALDVIAQLKPVTYTWKATGESTQGFIAHELQEVVPECVTGEKDAIDAEGNPVYQGIDTSFLVATLTSAIQEQQALIQQLTQRIETLEAK